MPTAGGPNTLGESNLVFAYDTGDVSNSYLGAPTTNICTGADYSIYNDGATNARNQTSPLPFKPGYEVVKVTANTPGTYGQSILWTANYSSTPTTATNSVYAWLQSGNYVQVGQHWHPWNYGSPKYIEKGKWVRISETYAINEGGSYGAAAMVYSTDGVAYFCMPQYELKPYQTPFVNFLNSRLATEGLLTLVGTNTIDLSNVSFDSNAQIEFDGTNDFIDTNFPATTLNTPTIEAVVYRSTATGRYEAIVQSNLASDDALYVYPGGTLGFWPCSVSSLPVPTGQWCYVAVSYNGTNLIYCVNGTIQTITATCTDITDWDFLRIGAHGVSDGERWIGKIAVSKVYDRALTAQEMQQNYQQYKTRFNLS